MGIFGLSIVRTSRLRAKDENAKHWKALFAQKEQYCDKLVDDFYAREEKSKKEYSTLKYKWMQKLSLVAKKQKKIELLRIQLVTSDNNLKAIVDQAKEDYQRQLDVINVLWDEKREYQRVIKCLRENVRARNIRIAKLKDGINIPDEIAKKDEKIKDLCNKLAKDRRTIYDLSKRLEAAKEYIRARKEADRLSTGR